MQIVIDGYNLIRQSAWLSELDHMDLQAGRDALVDALAAYKKMKPFPITVVFDGADAPADLPRRDRRKGIEVRYSRSGELADNVIKRMAARMREKLMVVSSDGDVKTYAAARGAAVIDAVDFEKRMAMARMVDMKGAPEEDDGQDRRLDTKKTGPSRRLPKQQRRMRRKIAKL
ncbi:NYN domain-containing protein [Desulfatitalea alkaliphila]|uniref:NYN domain-containing protein n=1 Tax=Desulfatitalea alkaliphila TaxID=2929485 RepID=A0AA41R5F2_9BACT|nr:NYN domain-containing protein [Desulfatitalea alkaliphila]MCJ8501320.1 NYN domain-containing protein [Desulfatitalea alkaliphila]